MKSQVKNLLIATSFLAGISGSAAYADNRAPEDTRPVSDVYGSISGGVTWASHDNTGGGGNIALGTRFLPSDFGDFRAELQAGYRNISPSHYFTYMGNLYYDFDSFKAYTPWKLVPYLGVGLGDARVHFNETGNGGDFTQNDDVFAYQVMAGVNFTTEQMPNTEWFVGYSHLGSDNINATDNLGFHTSKRLSANNVDVGLRYHF